MPGNLSKESYDIIQDYSEYSTIQVLILKNFDSLVILRASKVECLSLERVSGH
jgi:hypothetical protein